ncbi:MFS transporter [Loigolactobacillus rennini]|uniref:Major facilitator family transporter n=1 Tax=Loigolactobacillus rennini DSM 20253 TaxID=1423796 RepID=A0A0R2D901_9LACO|nr:MFS transporter [Loigolactobacillus rennini]KRN00161.1 major facilitator family transporter [Loigolactobacillus rennini DSM 20253]
MIKTKDKNLITYLLSYFLYNTARVLPHAILTVLLLDKGMIVSQIALIQSFYMIAGLLFEFPSGILTDLWSEKRMYQLALICLFFSYLAIWLSNKFVFLCGAWFIYGLSSAAISGSLEIYFLRQYQNNDHKIRRFNVAYNYATLSSALIGGGIGSFIYAAIKIHIYIVALGILLLALLLITFFFRGNSLKPPAKQTNLIAEIKTIKNNTKLIFSVLQMAIYQIVAQLFFQFWQVMFLHKTFSSSYFGLFYVYFQIIALISNYLFNKMTGSKRHFLTISLITLFLLLALQVTSPLLFIICFTLFLFPFNIYNTQLFVDIEAASPPKVLSSIVSFSGTISSIISMLTLWLISGLNNLLNFKQMCIAITILFFGLSTFLLSVKARKNVK